MSESHCGTPTPGHSTRCGRGDCWLPIGLPPIACPTADEPNNDDMTRPTLTALILLALLSEYHTGSRSTHAAEPSTAGGNLKVLEVTAPKDLQIRSAANVPRADLSWTDNVEGEAGFLIERSDDGGKTFTEAARIRADSSSHIDHTVQRDIVYSYRVRAIGPDWATKPATTPAIRTADFQVFDAMLFQPKPDLRRTGMDAIYVAYAREFSATNAATYDHASEAATRATARRATRHGIAVIDIEHWPTDIRTASKAEVEEGLAKLATVIGWMRDERPDLKIGIYSVLPLRDYWTPVSYLAAKANPATPPAKLNQLAGEYDQWLEANAFVRERLGAKVDCTFPSLYTFYDDQAGWERYARANITEARKVDKPVYAFLWMEYHKPDPDPRGELIAGDYWRRQLDIGRELTDGIVIWGGWRRRWNSRIEWWRETNRFLRATG